MLTFKEYKKGYIERHPNHDLCTREGWEKIERAYRDYVENDELTKIKKEVAELRALVEHHRIGVVMNRVEQLVKENAELKETVKVLEKEKTDEFVKRKIDGWLIKRR